MTATGFYEQKSVRPGGLALVIAMHAAAFAGLMLVKTTVETGETPITRMFDVLVPRDPPPEPEPQPQRRQAQAPSRIDTPPPLVRTQPQGPIVLESPIRVPPVSHTIERVELAGTPDLPPPPPVRVEAQLVARDLQPPYPLSEESAQRDGRVQVRVTIGADGRVKAVERVSATSDAFWRATERHALSRWRFRPATLEGRPVESRKVMTVHFQIET